MLTVGWLYKKDCGRRTVLPVAALIAATTTWFLLGKSASTAGLPEQESIKAEVYASIAVANVHTHMTISNDEYTSVAIPFCGYLEICAPYARLEQWTPSGWRRTQSMRWGDVSFNQIVNLKKGESTWALFMFNPMDWKFADGNQIRYPGRVRVILLAWTDQDQVGQTDKAIEVQTNEFEIPAPPETWGPKVQSAHH